MKNFILMSIACVLVFTCLYFIADASTVTLGFHAMHAGASFAILAPIAIKGVDITDSEKLATELNKAFALFTDSLKGLTIEETDAKIKALGIDKINEALEAHGLELQNQKFSGGSPGGLKAMLNVAFKREGLAGEIKAAYESRHGQIEVTKAVGNLTTGNVTTDTGGNAILDMLNADEIRDIRLQMSFIEDYANVSSTSKPVYTYVDFIPGEGDITFLGEGGTKQQIDLDVVVRTESPVKAAGYEILTEESITDIPRMESNARNLLFRKYLLKRQDGILFGDGIGANPLGITHIAAAFNPASWTGVKVVDPNLHDVVIAVANEIFSKKAYTDDVEYFPNVCFINPSDFASLRLSKDKNGQYLFPAFTLYNDKSIDGIRIVPKNKIPAGYILMGDFMKLNIVNYVAYSIRIGWINDQFIKNLFTMLGEGRFYVYVKNLDQRAFIYDTIANVVAGIQLVQA